MDISMTKNAEFHLYLEVTTMNTAEYLPALESFILK